MLKQQLKYLQYYINCFMGIGGRIMDRKQHTFFALLLAALMVFNCGASVYADTSAGGEAEEDTVQNTTYNGGTDISAAAVDSITISGDGINPDGSVNAYADFTVTVNFSEDNADGTQKTGLDIESGDTITVAWEAPDGVTFKGYSKTITLYQDGDSGKTQLGTAVVADDGVTITFNDNVNNLQHVKGSVTFTLQNHGNPSSGEPENGTIKSGDVTKIVTVNNGESIVEFGSKGGYYSTTGENRIYWTIWINNGKQTNLTEDSFIVITDTLPDTETFGGFISYAHWNGGDWNWELDTLDAFIEHGCSFEYNETEKTITIRIPASDLSGDAGEIRFWTTSTAEAGTVVNNTATMTHYETGNPEAISDDYTGSVTVPNSSGSASGIPKGIIKINKVVSGTTDPIKDVTFHIYQVNSSTDHTRVDGWYNGEDYAEITTDEKGTASIAGLKDGVYEIEEVTDNLPNWIAISDIESVYVIVSGAAGTEITIPNSVKTSTITATKNWTENDGTTADTGDHPTVYFRLYRNGTALTDDDLPDDQTAVQAVETASGESTATVTWANLPDTDSVGNAYTYTVKETDADGNDYTPSGYTKSEDGLTVTNKSTQKITGSKSNQDTTKSGNRIQATKLPTAVQTGDNGTFAAWLMVLLFSLTAAVMILSRKHNN